MRMVWTAIMVVAVAWGACGKTVWTPHGERAEECVLTVPSGAVVEEAADVGGKAAVRVVPAPPADGAVAAEPYIVTVPDTCHTDAVAAMGGRGGREKTAAAAAAARGGASVGFSDGWQIYYSWFGPDQGHFGHFSGTVEVPPTPTADAGQVLFYFLGLENLDDDAPVNILQPVLTYNNGVKGWNGASWACCPKNITVQSPTLTGFTSGDVLNGTMQRLSPDQWAITLAWGEKETTLKPVVGSYDYTWADITLEAYQVSACDQFSPGKTVFADMSLKTDAGVEMIDKAAWQKTALKTCNGDIALPKPTEAVISHGTTAQ